MTDTMTITDEQWATAKRHFDEVKAQYVDLMGMPGVSVGPALMVTFEPLARRFNKGERSPELYQQLLSVE